MAQAMGFRFLAWNRLSRARLDGRGVLGEDDEGGLVLDAFVQGGQLHPVLLSQAGEIGLLAGFAHGNSSR